MAVGSSLPPNPGRAPHSISVDDISYKDRYAVALSAKGKIVILNFISQQTAQGLYRWGNLAIYDSIEAAANSEDVPSALLAEALEREGIVTEELDI